MGPSPRARGSLRYTVGVVLGIGSIPACAGKPLFVRKSFTCERVHPRVRGEAFHVEPPTDLLPGPSPRARGSPSLSFTSPYRTGSIPACAGKPPTTLTGLNSARVHPRVRGEAAQTSALRPPSGGPSPRARGSHERGRRVAFWLWSIPACAGKPLPCSDSRCRSRVHPRVRGEANENPHSVHTSMGPSPRARGSPPQFRHVRVWRRSIPACAGKP